VFAIQDQVIATRVYEAKIMNMTLPHCYAGFVGRLKTIIHLLSFCPSLAVSAYLYPHNLVARVLHWYLSKIYSFPLKATSWYIHKPLPVVETSITKSLWDFSLVLTCRHPSNQPDLVSFDYQQKSILFVEVSCPVDMHLHTFYKKLMATKITSIGTQF